MPMTDAEVIELWRANVSLGDIVGRSGRDQSDVYMLLVNSGELARSIRTGLEAAGLDRLKYTIDEEPE